MEVEGEAALFSPSTTRGTKTCSWGAGRIPPQTLQGPARVGQEYKHANSEGSVPTSPE